MLGGVFNMNKKEIEKIIKQARERGNIVDLRNADLQDTDLQCTDLRNVDLRYANLRYADLQNTDLRCADLRDTDLRNANLRNAVLRYANLRNADLQDTDLDFSVFPLWCGSFNIKDNGRLIKQLLGHIARIECTDKEISIWIKKIPKKYSNDICKRHSCISEV